MTPTEQLRALHAKTSPGTWRNGIDDLEGVVVFDCPDGGNVVCAPPYPGCELSIERWPDNAAFIAAAHKHWLPLLDEIDRLRGEGPSEEEVALFVRDLIGLGELPEYRTDDDRGLDPDEYVDFAIRVLALRSSGPTEEIRGSDSDVEKPTTGASSALQGEYAVSVFDPSEPRPAQATGKWSDVWSRANPPTPTLSPASDTPANTVKSEVGDGEG